MFNRLTSITTFNRPNNFKPNNFNQRGFFSSRYPLILSPGSLVLGLLLAGSLGCSNTVENYHSTGGAVQAQPNASTNQPVRKVTEPRLISETVKPFNPQKVSSLLVLPLKSALPGAVSDSQLAELTEDLIHTLQQETTLQVLNKTEPESAAKAIQAVKNQPSSAVEIAKTAGQLINAPAVMSGIVTHYSENSGSRLGAERPARVGFRLYLVDPQAKAVIWNTVYDEQDQPLSDNLFRLKEKLESGMGFKSAQELANRGFTQAAKSIETIRQQNKSK